MNVLIVYAHPEPRSLNGALRSETVSHLRSRGHHVQVSDLYAMNWNAVVSPADSRAPQGGARFDPSLASRDAYEAGLQADDIAAEQEKLRWADVLILQFPLWWFSMPAIMKGWVDRVYAYGFAYGVGEHSDTHWGDRYGEGTLAGKRAMLLVTTGGWASHYAPRGVNGAIDDLLFPIQHGILFYAGFDVVPPFVVYRTGRLGDDGYVRTVAALRARLDTLDVIAPVPFRKQNGGDYAIPALTLREDLAPGEAGLHVHLDRTA
ncbi:NAD(P)H-dependent oxidoreductase [Chitinasiproducens palmae]|uniref:NAD(P)H dehydrogenase (Quinone) n=1 Tax=Chitinasiproducens palmae TaxID=1770053 RepID=A0A1H2PKA1_9BURK|nr:NAD(P)H-dependent oxidoreductase [Chitinasiproducens palmae]SDV46811.1 NAD(P)H dehydrogenase (quinone) [Chitinasiproducens palmae]